MRLLRAVWRFLTWLRQRIRWLVEGLVGPPAEAIGRILRGWRDRIDGALAAVLAWWSNIFQPQPKQDREKVDPPAPASWLAAAATLGLLLYTWPAQRYLTGLEFYGSAVGVWLIAVIVLRSWSRADSLNRNRRWLRVGSERVGLLRWEVLAAIASFALAALAIRSQPRVLPVALALLAGFVRLLVIPYQDRHLRSVLRPVRQPPPAPENGAEEHTFRWRLRLPGREEDNEMVIGVDLATYERLATSNPGTDGAANGREMPRWVVEGTTREVDSAAWNCFQIATERHHSTFAEISNVLAFVQSLPYTTDQETKGVPDYWRYPVETLRDETGDCEDSSILAAAVLRRLGHRVALGLLPGHVALGVEAPAWVPGTFAEVDSHRMYYCETTGEGWSVGEMPAQIKPREITWLPIS